MTFFCCCSFDARSIAWRSPAGVSALHFFFRAPGRISVRQLQAKNITPLPNRHTLKSEEKNTCQLFSLRWKPRAHSDQECWQATDTQEFVNLQILSVRFSTRNVWFCSVSAPPFQAYVYGCRRRVKLSLQREAFKPNFIGAKFR